MKRDKVFPEAEIARLRAENELLRGALRIGLELGERGNHGERDNCPTCHFVREARKALSFSGPAGRAHQQ